jgi:hypothetical protein
MIDFISHTKSFFSDVAKGAIEIYNEISLQNEFGLYLRKTFNTAFKTQFERPVAFFGLHRSNFVKKKLISLSLFQINQKNMLSN